MFSVGFNPGRRNYMTVRKAHTKQSKWAILERKVSLLPDRPRLKIRAVLGVPSIDGGPLDFVFMFSLFV